MCLVGAGTETSPVPAARATLACAALGLVEPAVPNFACKWHDMSWQTAKSPSTNMQTDIFPYTEHIFNCFSKDREIQAPLCYVSWPTVASFYLNWNLSCVVSHTKLISACDRSLPLSKSVHLWHFCKVRIIIIGIQPLGRSGQRPELSQATGMALVRCIPGKFFLGVACHCFPPLFRCSHFSPPGATTSARMWEIPAAEVELWARMLSSNFAEMTTSTPFRDLLHAANLRHWTNGFTSPPKEGVLRIFFRP